MNSVFLVCHLSVQLSKKMCICGTLKKIKVQFLKHTHLQNQTTL